MEQTRAINALAPFLALAKSASSPRQAADIVNQATSAANTYVFAELLQTPSVQSMRKDEQHGKQYELLELFTWGTWQDYMRSPDTLPKLNPAQAQKLRLLSLLTLAATASAAAALTYTSLQSALSLDTSQELQDLVTTAIYADLLQGSLDPAAKLVRVSSIAPLRDLQPGSAGQLVEELQAWEARCADVLAEIHGRMDEIRSLAEKKGKSKQERTRQEGRAERKWAPASERSGEDGLAAVGEGMGIGHGLGLRGGGRTLRSMRGDGDMMDVDGGGGGRR